MILLPLKTVAASVVATVALIEKSVSSNIVRLFIIAPFVKGNSRSDLLQMCFSCLHEPQFGVRPMGG
jgi:hypothetical protein